MLRYFCGLRTNNAVCVHVINGYTVIEGDADGHAVGVPAEGVRTVLVHPSAGDHAVGLRLRILSGYAVAVRAIVYMSTMYFLSAYVLQVPMLYLKLLQEAVRQVYCYRWPCCRCKWCRWP
jgi:hypothetical protein